MSISMSETRDRIASMLANMVGRVELGAGGELSFPYESTRVFVQVRPWAETSTVVNVFAITNVDLTPSPELFEFVAMRTGDWVFGHLGMSIEDGKATLYFNHNLLGDFLDEEELRTAVAAVALSSDDIDDKIKAEFGGQLATEA